MLVLVTFDLLGAPPAEYPRVKKALASLRLKKEIRSKNSGKLSKLPANTFAAVFTGKWQKRKAKKLRNYIRKQVQGVMKSLGLTATIFVAVGDKWAWSKR
jgi:hypothetical protein